MKSKLNKILFFIYPFAILLEAIFVEPYFTLRPETDTTPILQAILVIILIYINKGKIKKPEITLVIIISYLIATIFLKSIIFGYFELKTISFLIIFPIAFVMITVAQTRYKDGLLGYLLLGYILLSLGILVLRGIENEFDPAKIRGGMNIFGGASLIHIILIFIIFYIKQTNNTKKILNININININLMLIFAFIISIIYGNRLLSFGLSITTIFIILRHLLNNTITVVSILVIGIAVIEYNEFIKLVLELLLLRLDLEQISDGNYSNILLGREELWMEAIKLIKNNPLGYGIDSFYILSESGYSSPHNLILSSILEVGLIFTIIYIAYILKILKFLNKEYLIFKNSYIYLLKILILLLVVISTAVTGETIIQLNGWISPLFIIFCIAGLIANGNILKDNEKI